MPTDTELFDCHTCGGLGWNTEEICCGRALDICGGLGCTGAEPMQIECNDCYGTGKQPSNNSTT